jgi:hypothetical protein
MAKKAKATQDPKTETTATFTRAEIIEQLKGLAPDELLAAVAEVTTPEQRKSISAKETARVAREKREKELAETTATRNAERVAIEAMSEDDLAVYSPKHQTECVRETRLKWSGSEWVETTLWFFGKDRASRSGASIAKRVIDPERIIFPSGVRLELRGTEYVHASKVCEALGITWKPDSAARVLCSESIIKMDSLGVTVRVTTPAGTTSGDLYDYARKASDKGLLDTRPE